MVSTPRRALADTCRGPTLLLKSESEFWHEWESRESDVNTTDWRKTVKLPFVKEKQEASCGRPSMDGWEDTAGRKPHLHSGEKCGTAD